MRTLVIQEWKASNVPIDEEGNYVSITGRDAGFFAWMLDVMKLDGATKVRLSRDYLTFTTASLSGSESRHIPVENICSCFSGYYKPLKPALAIFVVCLLFWGIPSAISMMMANLMRDFEGRDGFAVLNMFAFMFNTTITFGPALLYYYLNKSLTLGFVEHSGVVSVIRFKRSVIENVGIDEASARYVCEVARYLVQPKGVGQPNATTS